MPPPSLHLPPGSDGSVWWGDDKTTSPPHSSPPRWIVPQRLCHSKLFSGEIEASSLFFSFQGFSLSAEAADRFKVQPAGIVLFIKNPVTVKHLWYRVGWWTRRKTDSEAVLDAKREQFIVFISSYNVNKETTTRKNWKKCRILDQFDKYLSSSLSSWHVGDKTLWLDSSDILIKINQHTGVRKCI